MATVHTNRLFSTYVERYYATQTEITAILGKDITSIIMEFLGISPVTSFTIYLEAAMNYAYERDSYTTGKYIGSAVFTIDAEKTKSDLIGACHTINSLNDLQFLASGSTNPERIRQEKYRLVHAELRIRKELNEYQTRYAPLQIDYLGKNGISVQFNESIQMPNWMLKKTNCVCEDDLMW